MSKDKKERRCMTCGKLLLDEKLPLCRRCVLKGRSRAAKVGIVLLAVIGGASLIKNSSDKNGKA